MDTIDKNSKYKIVHYNDEHFIIDINRNIITYVFPLFNYFNKQKLIKISEEEMYNIRRPYIIDKQKEKSSGILSACIATSLFIGFIGRPFIDYMDFKTNVVLNILLLVIILFPLIILKGVINLRNREKINISQDRYIGKALVLPNTKEMLKNILINTLLTLFVIAVSLGTIKLKESSIIYILVIMVAFSLILFQNRLLYNKTTIEGKISKIKLKK
ncbi:DUF443 family protein [Staphylococcus pettenkoferi]|nr:DUF443 family protein [Staphylococcus pettenkoferi]